MAKTRLDSDEKYVLNLVAEVLGEEYEWQKRFDTLLGDPGKLGRGSRLPVDAFYPQTNLIIEYREKQHTKPVGIMDNRMTVSGVLRSEQREIYDSRKEKWAADNGILLLAISYSDLACNKNGRLLRSKEEDIPKVKLLLDRVFIK